MHEKKGHLNSMNFKNLTDQVLYQIVKRRAPEIPIDMVDDSNRKMVIAVLQVTEKLRQRRGFQQHNPPEEK